MHYTQWLKFSKQRFNTAHVDATTRVLGDVPVRARPEVDLDRVAGNDTPNARIDIDAREAEANAVESDCSLNVERGQHRGSTVQSWRDRRGSGFLDTPNG